MMSNHPTGTTGANPSFIHHIRFIFFITLVFFLLLIYTFQTDVFTLSLKDNDDFMRYFQFTQWIKTGNWYLQPLPHFNPQDGVLIHWSRLPDIPLALISLLAAQFVDQSTAHGIAMIIVPLLYLLGTVSAVGWLTYRILGTTYITLSCFYLLASYIVTKFFPGFIDHHNLQLLLAAWFLALLPFTRYECKSHRLAVVLGIILALSFWVGLENLIFFALLLFVITILGYTHSVRYLYFCRLLCLSAVLFGVFFCLLNRPSTEFFQGRIDAISWPYLFCLFVGALFCHLSIHLHWPAHKLVKYAALGGFSLSLILLTTPDVLFGVYHNYPALLSKYWLSQVSEAISILGYISTEGLLGKHNYLLPILPALLTVFCLNQDKRLKLAYGLMVILILPALFWQARTIFLVFLLAAPLQACFAIHAIRKTQSKGLQALIAIICMPLVISFAIMQFNHSQTQEKIQPRFRQASISEMLMLLRENHVLHDKVLTPIDFGAPILARTDNRVISAPYHRNIKGNTLAIQIFTTTDRAQAKKLLIGNKLNYILIGNDNASQHLRKLSQPDSFMNQLDKNQLPDWLQLLSQGAQYGTKLYKVHH